LSHDAERGDQLEEEVPERNETLSTHCKGRASAPNTRSAGKSPFYWELSYSQTKGKGKIGEVHFEEGQNIQPFFSTQGGR